MIYEYDRRRIIERKKIQCREKIEFHKKNKALQLLVSFACVAGGIYAGQKESIIVPLVLAPTAAASCSKLIEHEIKRKHYEEILNRLERN